MAYKKRSAKQRANTKKLVALNRKRAKPKRRKSSKPKRTTSHKTTKRRSSHKKTNKKRGGSKSMVKIPKLPPVVMKVAAGIGLASIGVTVLSFVAPSIANNQIVKPALAFVGGGLPAALVQFLLGGGTQLLGGNGGDGGSA